MVLIQRVMQIKLPSLDVQPDYVSCSSVNFYVVAIGGIDIDNIGTLDRHLAGSQLFRLCSRHAGLSKEAQRGFKNMADKRCSTKS